MGECRIGGNKLSNVRGFILLRLEEGFLKTTVLIFWGEKSTMEISVGAYFFRCAIKLLNLVLESKGLYYMATFLASEFLFFIEM